MTYGVTDSPLKEDRAEWEAVGLRRRSWLGDARELDGDLVLPLASVGIGVDHANLPQRVTGVLVEILPLTLSVVRPLRDGLSPSPIMKAPREK